MGWDSGILFTPLGASNPLNPGLFVAENPGIYTDFRVLGQKMKFEPSKNVACHGLSTIPVNLPISSN